MKNLFSKFLAMMLAMMLAIPCVCIGRSALAEKPNSITAENETKNVQVDLEGFAYAVAAKDEKTVLVIDGTVTDNVDGGATVAVRVSGGGEATVQTGDVTRANSVGWQDEAGLDVFISGEDSKADATVGSITSDNNGVFVANYGGTVKVATESVDAENTGILIVTEKKVEEIADSQIKQEELINNLGARPYEYYADQEIQTYMTSSGDMYAEFYEPRNGFHYAKCRIDDSAGSTTVMTDGDITVKGNYTPYGIQVNSENENQQTNIVAEGKVSVTADGDKSGGATGVFLLTFGGDISFSTSGDITVSAKGEGNKTYGIESLAYRERNAVRTIVTGDITVSGGTDESGFGMGVALMASDKATVENRMIGDVNVSGNEMEGISICAVRDGSAAITMEGDVNAEGTEATQAVYALNSGGTIKIDITGDVTSSGDGLFLKDTANLVYDEDLIRTKVTVVPTEYDETIEYTDNDGKHKVYHHEEPNGSWYDYIEDGTIIDAQTMKDHDPGTTEIKITGDVSAEEAGISINLTTEKSRMDVIVDGTVSGKKQSVLLSEDTIADNLTLTVWEIKANNDGNLVERETADGTTEADRDIEKNIQYIIKVEPTQKDIISTQGTTQYEGYDVANEGDTVTLKVEVPDGYQIKNAFSDTAQTVTMARDDDGNHYLIVPKGGAVMISVEFEKLPESEPKQKTEPGQETEAEQKTRPEIIPVIQPIIAAETQPVVQTPTQQNNAAVQQNIATTKVAIMKPADETTETTTLKDLVENNGILNVLPDEIREQLPEGVSTVAATVTMTLENYDETMGAVTLKIAPKKTYTKGEKATVVIALPDGNGGYTYFYIEGEGQEDGTLSLNIPADTAKAIAGKTFVTMILE